jgi:hypothetical protein
MSISITQGDYVLYQDTSVGNPTGRAWNFPGGTPTGATASNPIVRYLSPSGSGFPAKLTITKGSINTFKEETNIIIVTPENISVALTSSVPAGTTIPMGTTVTYTAVGSTASLSYYNWSLAGVAGFTGTNPNESTSILSWLDLTGSDSGATYSTYTSTSSVIFNSFLGNTTSSNTNVTYSKNGGFEPYNYLTDAYTIGANYYYITNTGLSTVTVGMPGAGDIFLVDTNYISSLPINNTQFRAQGEIVSYFSSSQDIEFLAGSYGYYPGQYVASLTAFQYLGVTPNGWESLSRYTVGNYMIPGDLADYFFNVFYFADVFAYGKSMTVNRYWTDALVDSLIFNETSFGYQSSRALELSIANGNAPTAYKEGLDGAGGASGGLGGACLPAAVFTGFPTVELNLTIRFSNNGDIDSINPSLDVVVNVIVSDLTISGGQGNSPDGQLVFMQDTPAGDGVATSINNALTALGYDSNIIAFASPDYAWASGLPGPLAYDVNTFNGLKIAIIDRGSTNPYITAVDLSDNGPWPPYINYPGVPNPIGTINSNWISFNTDRIANPYQLNVTSDPQPKRGWEFGY